MITNSARFALLPVILLAGPAPVSAKQQIVPAVCEPVQAIAVYKARYQGKAAADYARSCESGCSSSVPVISDNMRYTLPSTWK